MDDTWNIDTPLTFSSYEEIANRPNFNTEIDISTTKIDKLIAVYRFPEKQYCGKKGCHQPHNNGWLAVAIDGRETLIGSRCGLEWGGDAFTIQKSQLNKLINRNAQIKTFYEVLNNTDTILDRVHEIKTRAKGANWLDKTLTKLRDNCTQEMMRKLTSRAGRSETVVTIDTLKTKDERDLEELRDSNERASAYKSEVIGNLVGLEVFNHDLREVLMVGIYEKAQRLKKIDPTALSTPALNSLLKDIRGFDNLFREAEEILTYGTQFFSTPSNFSLIKTMDKERKHNHLTQINWFRNSKGK